MKLRLIVILLIFIKPVFGENYIEQYGSIKLSGTSFIQDISKDNRKNSKLDSELEYNFYLEKDNNIDELNHVVSYKENSLMSIDYFQIEK